MSTDRRGDWIQTFTGRKFWPLDPRPEDIFIDDIAHALSRKCRFSGHCVQHYSVAQHSVLVSQMVPHKFALWGLLHDAAEAYLPDVSRPIKSDMPGFAEIEERVMRAVAEKFGLSWPEPAIVKHADTQLLVTEKRDVMGPGPAWGEWTHEYTVLPQRIVPIERDPAKEQFLFHYRELVGLPHPAPALKPPSLRDWVQGGPITGGVELTQARTW